MKFRTSSNELLNTINQVEKITRSSSIVHRTFVLVTGINHLHILGQANSVYVEARVEATITESGTITMSFEPFSILTGMNKMLDFKILGDKLKFGRLGINISNVGTNIDGLVPPTEWTDLPSVSNLVYAVDKKDPQYSNLLIGDGKIVGTNRLEFAGVKCDTDLRLAVPIEFINMLPKGGLKIHPLEDKLWINIDNIFVLVSCSTFYNPRVQEFGYFEELDYTNWVKVNKAELRQAVNIMHKLSSDNPHDNPEKGKEFNPNSERSVMESKDGLLFTATGNYLGEGSHLIEILDGKGSIKPFKFSTRQMYAMTVDGEEIELHDVDVGGRRVMIAVGEKTRHFIPEY